MSDDREQLSKQDWSEFWEDLPEAPPLIPRPKSAQLTLRLSQTLLDRVKRVAATMTLPYHALVRSWIIEGLLQAERPSVEPSEVEPQSAQLNIKLDHEVLDELKQRAHEFRQPYHRLAREWMELAVAQAEVGLGLAPLRTSRPAVKDLMILLLHAPNQTGDSTVRGITRLQKLLFVIEKTMSLESKFYAYNYGPFNEEVNDAAQSLQLSGFLRDTRPPTDGPPTFTEMMAKVARRAGPREDAKIEVFALNATGHELAEQLRRSNEAYSQIYSNIESIRAEWDSDDLLDRVYEMFPDYTGKSRIKQEVDRRNQRRRSGGL